jgi:hypothetical protein
VSFKWANSELRRLFSRPTSHENGITPHDTGNGDNPLSYHHASLNLMDWKRTLIVLLQYCLVLLYCTVHDSGVSADASRVGPR